MFYLLRGITKVTGEVDMSFATSFLQQLSSHDPLTFRLTNKDTVERLQHNRNLVTLYVCVCVHACVHVRVCPCVWGVGRCVNICKFTYLMLHSLEMMTAVTSST